MDGSDAVLCCAWSLNRVWLFSTSWTVAHQDSSVHGDSPGKDTGVGCHALPQGIFPNPGIEPRSPTLQADSLPSELPGKPKNTGMGSLSLLQGNFLTQELNWCLLHCRWILYQLSHTGSPRILEWVAYSFSSGSSQPKNWTGVFCIAGGFFTNWAITEASQTNMYTHVYIPGSQNRL